MSLPIGYNANSMPKSALGGIIFIYFLSVVIIELRGENNFGGITNYQQSFTEFNSEVLVEFELIFKSI